MSAPPPNAGASALVESGSRALHVALQAADALTPVIERGAAVASSVWAKAAPHHPEDFLPLAFGLVLLFFGGQFPVLIASVEAFRLTGWQHTKHALGVLYVQYQTARDASRKDDLVDDNADGTPDVQQITRQQLLSRKLALFLRVTDPVALNEGMQGLAAGASAVVATLRVRFAQTVTLGVALGDVFTRTADTFLRPALVKVVPQPYQKWIGLGIRYICRSLAVTVAWWCTRIISAMHSSTRGAQLILSGITLLAARFSVPIPFDFHHPESTLYPVLCGTLGAFGLYCQLARGFRLPFPLNILFLPLRILEWLMFYVLSWSPNMVE